MMNPAADLILFNGTIRTRNHLQPNARAIAVSGARILDVGPDEKIKGYGDSRTKFIDLEHRLVLPGFMVDTTIFNGKIIHGSDG